jgi:hypothetical protein
MMNRTIDRQKLLIDSNYESIVLNRLRLPAQTDEHELAQKAVLSHFSHTYLVNITTWSIATIHTS